MIARITGLLCVLLLATCQRPPVTAAAVYDAKRALFAADIVALNYLAQPRCVGAVLPTCRDEATATRIKQASAQASATRRAVDAAIVAGAVPDVATLTAAVAAYGAVVAPYAR